MTDIADRFARDTAGHTMAVLHDDGLYRHLRFAAPNNFYWFDLITWPGRLAITGGFGDNYMFDRMEDMFEFFRGQRVNPQYWAEKIADGRERAERYSEDKLRDRLKAELDEYEQAYPAALADYRVKVTRYEALPERERWPLKKDGVRKPDAFMPPKEAREVLADAEADGETMYEDGARRVLADLESGGILADTIEWDLADWDWTFLWACHAIVWGISQYDTAKTAETAGAA